jgi:hypothetical protein
VGMPFFLPLTEPERLRNRHHRVRHIFEPISTALSIKLAGDTSMANMTRLAEQVAKARRVGLDRMARRTKEALIWALGFRPPHLPRNAPPIPTERRDTAPFPPRPVAAPVPPRRPLPVPLLAPRIDVFHLSEGEMTAEDETAFWGNEI